MWEESRVQY